MNPGYKIRLAGAVRRGNRHDQQLSGRNFGIAVKRGIRQAVWKVYRDVKCNGGGWTAASSPVLRTGPRVCREGSNWRIDGSAAAGGRVKCANADSLTIPA
jgi:hypothetical protein